MPFKFVYVCDLLQELEDLEIKDRDVALPTAEKNLRYYTIVSNWFRDHRKLIDNPATDKAALLSTLLPERRVDRVYGLQPPGLLKVLGRSLRIGTERSQRLKLWTSSNEEDLSTWVTRILKATDPGMPSCNASVEEIDTILENVAAKCRYSSRQIRSRAAVSANDTVDSLMSPLLNNLPSRELKWFLRLVLKKFHPVVLEEKLILKQAHFLLPKMLKFKSDFGVAIELLNKPLLRDLPTQPDVPMSLQLNPEIAALCFCPQVGVKVGRPHFEKARSLKQCLKLTKNSRWSIEPKIDGEYCQLHIDLSKGDDWLQIFSKYGRDSTHDRRGLRQWIRQCLQIGSPECRIKDCCILEGEMVVYNEKEECIAPFHKIRKHVSRAGSFLGTENDSQAHPHEKLTVVFFDALLIDDEVVMAFPYHERRKKLKDLIFVDNEEYTKSFKFEMVDFSALSARKAQEKLETHFANAMARRYEGLVLKPYDRPYFQGPQPHASFAGYVKMKRDYIPGLGDTSDFAIIGATRDTRAETIHKAKWNCFIIACIVNKEEVHRFAMLPNLQAMESISRPCISEEDARYISLTGLPFEGVGATNEDWEHYNLLRGSFNKEIEVQFKIPFVVEVTGSGFDKMPSTSHFSLRHPRITKIHGDRTVKDIVSFDELQNMAREAKTQPPDLKAEELKWAEYLRDLGRPNRLGSAMEGSPFSNATSNNTSPCTVRSGKTRSQQTSPLVRVDSSELILGEHRDFGSPSLQNRQNQTYARDLGQMLTPPPTAPLPTAPLPTAPLPTADIDSNSAPEKKAVETTKYLKRKADDHQIQTTSDSSQPKRVFGAKSSHRIDSNCSNTASSSQKIPLTEITNNNNGFDRHTTSHTNPRHALKRCRVNNGVAESKSSSTGLGSDDSFFSAVTEINENRITQMDDQQLEFGNMLVHRLVHQQQQVETETVGKSGLTANNTVEKEAIEPLKRQNGYHEQCTRSPLELSVVYISECLQTVPYLTEDLLPKLAPAHVTKSLSHWSRDLLYLSPFAPVVGESQAYPDLQKVVLVEAKRKTQTKEVIRSLLKIKLEYGEEMRVWDWRLTESLVEYMKLGGDKSLPESQNSENIRFEDSGSQNFSSQDQVQGVSKEDLLVEKLAKCYLGTVMRDDQQDKSVWLSANSEIRRGVANDLASFFKAPLDF